MCFYRNHAIFLLSFTYALAFEIPGELKNRVGGSRFPSIRIANDSPICVQITVGQIIRTIVRIIMHIVHSMNLAHLSHAAIKKLKNLLLFFTSVSFTSFFIQKIKRDFFGILLTLPINFYLIYINIEIFYGFLDKFME